MHEFDVLIQYRYYKVVLSLAKHFQLSIVVSDFQAIIATEIKILVSLNEINLIFYEYKYHTSLFRM